MSAGQSPTPERVAALALFSSLAPTQLAHIAGLLQVVTVPDGEHVVRQGDEGGDFYVIESGTAEVSVDGVVVRKLDAGDFFGEIAPLRFGRRTASVVALTELNLFMLSRFNLRLLAAVNPSISDTLEAAAAERLTEASPKPLTEP